MAEIPTELKQSNWNLFRLAQSADPTLAVEFTQQLIASLKTTMAIAEIHDYDRMLDYEFMGAHRAMKEYDDGESLRALQTRNNVLSKVGILIYDRRFTEFKVMGEFTDLR